MMATHWIVVIVSVVFLMGAQKFGGTVMMTISLSKSTLTKKVIEDQNVFRSEVMVRQEVNDGIQRSISYIKDEL